MCYLQDQYNIIPHFIFFSVAEANSCFCLLTFCIYYELQNHSVKFQRYLFRILIGIVLDSQISKNLIILKACWHFCIIISIQKHHVSVPIHPSFPLGHISLCLLVCLFVSFLCVSHFLHQVHPQVLYIWEILRFILWQLSTSTFIWGAFVTAYFTEHY